MLFIVLLVFGSNLTKESFLDVGTCWQGEFLRFDSFSKTSLCFLVQLRDGADGVAPVTAICEKKI